MTSIGRRAVRLELRLTHPDASLAELEAAVALAVEHECAAISVNPWLVRAAKRALGRARVRLSTVVAFPHGSQILAVKAFEASKALEQGANQIDFVMNVGALVSGDDDIVYNDMLAVVDMAHSALAVAGVIVHAERLPAELVSKACRLAERAGVDHAITSAGDVAARRAVQHAALVRDSVGPRVQVKAAGRFRAIGDVRAAAAAGASMVSAPVDAELARAVAQSLRQDDEDGVLPGLAAGRPSVAGSRAG